MKIIRLTPHSPYCKEFENEALLHFSWLGDMSGLHFHGVLVEGTLVARVAWQLDPGWCSEPGVLGIATLETLPRFRCQGFGQALVNYLRAAYPEKPVVFEVNSPFAFHFWQRYRPVYLGRGRGAASLYKIPPLTVCPPDSQLARAGHF